MGQKRNILYSLTASVIKFMKLPVESFIRIDVVEEAVASMPPEPPGIIQQVNQLNPGYWYNKLNLSGLEQKFRLPNKILLHLIDIESKGNPDATSHKGAKSLFGIMPSGKSGFTGNIEDPAETALFAAKTLSYLINHFGSVEQGLAAYNWGMGNLAKKGIYNAPKQTKDYIRFFKKKGIIPKNGVVDSNSWGEEDFKPVDNWQ